MTQSLDEQLLDEAAQALLGKAEKLEAAAAKLREAARRLIDKNSAIPKEREESEEAQEEGSEGEVEEPEEQSTVGTPDTGWPSPRLPVIQNRDGSLTRFAQIARFLQHHGPSRKAAIVARSGVPEGSIRALLNYRNFVQSPDGVWECYPHTPHIPRGARE